MALYEKNGVSFFDSQLVSHISQGENEKAQSFLAGLENLCNLKNSAGKTLLHIAARYGNAAMTKYFIDMGFQVDAQNNFGITPLALAVQYCQVETIAILLKAKADIYNSEHRECLLKTVHNSCMARRRPVKIYQRIFKMFSDRVRVDFQENKRSVGEKLWDAKCSLYLVVKILGSPKPIRYYIKSGYDVNTPELYGQCTALHGAVEMTAFSIVKILVENGADVNAFDANKHTPLCYYNYASRESDVKLDMLEYLIDHGAWLTLSGNLNYTPLEHLLTHGNLRTVSAVLKKDIDLTATHRLRRTPLHFLAKNTTPDVMSLIRGKAFDVDARDKYGTTALMAAIQKNKNLSAIEFLLDSGADINAENNGQTPLCYAVSFAIRANKLGKSTFEICKLLLQRGANIQHVFKTFKKKKVIQDQVTIFDVILKNRQFEISKLLLAQLVLNSVAQGEPITDLIRARIESDRILNEQFNVCKEQIEKMKGAKINESMTLFELMIGDEDKMVQHAIDFEFMSKLDELNDILRENSYYVDIIKKRVERIVKQLKSTNELEIVNNTQSSCCIS